MIAADWFGIRSEQPMSARATRLCPAIDRLEEDDAELVETLVGRLGKP